MVGSVGTDYLVQCPHCSLPMPIPCDQINCQIFRHGTYRSNYQAIPPHLSKERCNYLVANKLIDGCGKPFRFNGTIVTKCDYI